MNKTDEQLYDCFITAGDEESFRSLFDRYRNPLMRFIYEIQGMAGYIRRG